MADLAQSLADGDTRTCCALIEADPTKAKCLLPDGQSPLLAAIRSGARDVVQCLLNEGVSLRAPENQDALEAAISTEDPVLVRLLTTNKDSSLWASESGRYLTLAARAKNPEILTDLVHARHNVDAVDGETGRNALHVSCQENWTAGVELLLSLGSNPLVYEALENQLPLHLLINSNPSDELTLIPLITATIERCRREHSASLRTVIKLVLDTCFKYQSSSLLETCLKVCGGDAVSISSTTHGMPYLHLAVSQEWYDGARLLLQYHANPQQAASTGRTPLFVAVRMIANPRMANLLLQNGADSNFHRFFIQGSSSVTQSLLMESLTGTNPQLALNLLQANCEIDNLIYTTASRPSLDTVSPEFLLSVAHGILSCGCPVHRLRHFVDNKLTTVIDDAQIVQQLHELQVFLSSPLPLKAQCRAYMKRYFGRRGRLCALETRAQRGIVSEKWRLDFYYAVSRLPLPQAMKDYLLLSDLIPLN